MPQKSIHFFSENIPFKLKDKAALRKWINDTVVAENHRISELNFIFCDDEYLLAMNQQYLDHNTYTDVITFDNSELDGVLVGDIFISIDRVRENATNFKVSERDELIRVMIHGTLHLLGYPDKGKVAKELMTSKEDFYLQKLLS